MELRKRGKEDNQETNLSVKNPTNDATFRKSGEKEKQIGSRANGIILKDL